MTAPLGNALGPRRPHSEKGFACRGRPGRAPWWLAGAKKRVYLWSEVQQTGLCPFQPTSLSSLPRAGSRTAPRLRVRGVPCGPARVRVGNHRPLAETRTLVVPPFQPIPSPGPARARGSRGWDWLEGRHHQRPGLRQGAVISDAHPSRTTGHPSHAQAWGCSRAGTGERGERRRLEGTETSLLDLRPEIDALFSSCEPPWRPARAPAARESLF